MARKAAFTSRVKMLAESPKRVWLAAITAASRSGTRMIERTGPKISSCAMRSMGAMPS